MGRVRQGGTAEGGQLIAVLDTGGIGGLAPIDERRRARLRVLRAQATDILVPAAVLAEGVLTGHPGRDFHVRRLLELVGVVSVDEQLGHAAGSLRHHAVSAGTQPPPSGIDAIVAALADDVGARNDVAIITSDGDDLELLASFGRHAVRISVIVV